MRLLFGYQWLFPGKPLLFMGGEIGQRTEWNEDGEVAWELLEENELHVGLQQWVADLNHLYRDEPALWAGDYSEGGFYWIDNADHAAGRGQLRASNSRLLAPSVGAAQSRQRLARGLSRRPPARGLVARGAQQRFRTLRRRKLRQRRRRSFAGNPVAQPTVVRGVYVAATELFGVFVRLIHTLLISSV